MTQRITNSKLPFTPGGTGISPTKPRCGAPAHQIGARVQRRERLIDELVRGQPLRIDAVLEARILHVEVDRRTRQIELVQRSRRTRGREPRSPGADRRAPPTTAETGSSSSSAHGRHVGEASNERNVADLVGEVRPCPSADVDRRLRLLHPQQAPSYGRSNEVHRSSELVSEQRVETCFDRARPRRRTAHRRPRSPPPGSSGPL